MSTELDALDGVRDAAVPGDSGAPRLTPPPRPTPASRRPGASAASWLTAAFFAVLTAIAIAVFVALPDWVRGRQGRLAAERAVEPSTAAVQGRAAAGDPAGDPAPEVAPPATNPPATGPPDSLPPVAEPEPAAAAPGPTARAVARSQPRPDDHGFERAMSDGLAALDRDDYPTAREAFARAAALRPGSAQSADGLARAEIGARLAAITKLSEQALALEHQEDWHGALERYDAVLELDPAVELALGGRARSRRRAELSDRIDFHLANRQRLAAESVLEEARAILAQAAEIEAAGAKLQQQKGQLAQAVAAFSMPVTATLESDRLTEVTVYKIGRLGSFSRRDLELRPGTYTVVGSRRGYRDVRRQLVIEPGVEPQPLEIRCEEKI